MARPRLTPLPRSSWSTRPPIILATARAKQRLRSFALALATAKLRKELCEGRVWSELLDELPRVLGAEAMAVCAFDHEDVAGLDDFAERPLRQVFFVIAAREHSREPVLSNGADCRKNKKGTQAKTRQGSKPDGGEQSAPYTRARSAGDATNACVGRGVTIVSKIFSAIVALLLVLPAHALDPASLSDAQIRSIIVQASRDAYYRTGHPCACPEDSARNGSRCGKRSAYSRPGGAAPYCYPSDVSEAEVARYRAKAGK